MGAQGPSSNFTSMPEWWQLLYGQYLDPIWLDSGGSGGGPTYSITHTELLPQANEGAIDYSWMWAPLDSSGGSGTASPDPGGGGGGGDISTMPNVEVTQDPNLVFTVDVYGQPILTPQPEVSTIPAEPLNPGIINPAYTWLPESLQPQQLQPPAMEPTPIYTPDDGTPTFPMDVWGTPLPKTPVETIPGTPRDPGIPTGPVTWLPIDNPGQQTTPNGPVFTPWFPSPDPTTPIPGTPIPLPPQAQATPPLPNSDIPVGDGAPGPGPLAPVVGDPVPKKSLFEGVYTPDKIPTLSEILAQVLHGGSYAR